MILASLLNCAGKKGRRKGKGEGKGKLVWKGAVKEERKAKKGYIFKLLRIRIAFTFTKSGKDLFDEISKCPTSAINRTRHKHIFNGINFPIEMLQQPNTGRRGRFEDEKHVIHPHRKHLIVLRPSIDVNKEFTSQFNGKHGGLRVIGMVLGDVFVRGVEIDELPDESKEIHIIQSLLSDKVSIFLPNFFHNFLRDGHLGRHFPFFLLFFQFFF